VERSLLEVQQRRAEEGFFGSTPLARERDPIDPAIAESDNDTQGLLLAYGSLRNSLSPAGRPAESIGIFSWMLFVFEGALSFRSFEEGL